MKIVDILEAETHLSEISEEVAATHEPVMVTKRGKPLVRIDPVDADAMTIRERREAYVASRGRHDENDTIDLQPSSRAEDVSTFGFGE